MKMRYIAIFVAGGFVSFLLFGFLHKMEKKKQSAEHAAVVHCADLFFEHVAEGAIDRGRLGVLAQDPPSFSNKDWRNRLLDVLRSSNSVD